MLLVAGWLVVGASSAQASESKDDARPRPLAGVQRVLPAAVQHRVGGVLDRVSPASLATTVGAQGRTAAKGITVATTTVTGPVTAGRPAEPAPQPAATPAATPASPAPSRAVVKTTRTAVKTGTVAVRTGATAVTKSVKVVKSVKAVKDEASSRPDLTAVAHRTAKLTRSATATTTAALSRTTGVVDRVVGAAPTLTTELPHQPVSRVVGGITDPAMAAVNTTVDRLAARVDRSAGKVAGAIGVVPLVRDTVDAVLTPSTRLPAAESGVTGDPADTPATSAREPASTPPATPPADVGSAPPEAPAHPAPGPAAPSPSAAAPVETAPGSSLWATATYGGVPGSGVSVSSHRMAASTSGTPYEHCPGCRRGPGHAPSGPGPVPILPSGNGTSGPGAGPGGPEQPVFTGTEPHSLPGLSRIGRLAPADDRMPQSPAFPPPTSPG